MKIGWRFVKDRKGGHMYYKKHFCRRRSGGGERSVICVYNNV